MISGKLHIIWINPKKRKDTKEAYNNIMNSIKA